jgi:hypothetical protein
MGMTSVELFAYPWDILDEGEAPFLDRCRQLGIDRLHVAVSYHSGKFLLPRNRRARVYFPEPGARYFQAPPATWQGGLDQPVSELAATGWLDRLAAGAAERRIELSAWTVFFHNSALGARYPDLTIENAFGDRYPFALCPSRQQVRDHAAAMCRSLACLGSFTAIDLETIGYLGYFHGHHHEVTAVPLGTAERLLLSLCFCTACRAAGTSAGIDMEHAAGEVRRILARRMESDDAAGGDRPGQLASLIVLCPWLQALARLRMNTVTALVQRLGGESLPARLAAYSSGFVGAPSNIWMEGLSLPDLKPLVECFHLLAYNADPAADNADLVFVLAMLGDPGLVNLTLNLGEPVTSTFAQAAAKVEFARRQGVRRFSFFNYGFLGEGRLRWIQDLASIARERRE